jgi:hypothetical protein
LNGVVSREEVVFDEKKRSFDGATARGNSNDFSVAIIRRLCACDYGTALGMARLQLAVYGK